MNIAAYYCDCGAAYVYSGSAPDGCIVVRQARAEHLALGHHEVDAKRCAAARRKAERQAE